MFSARALDMGSKGRWFETHRKHCAVSLSKTLCLLLSTGSTKEDRKYPDMTDKLLTRA